MQQFILLIKDLAKTDLLKLSKALEIDSLTATQALVLDGTNIKVVSCDGVNVNDYKRIYTSHAFMRHHYQALKASRVKFLKGYEL